MLTDADAGTNFVLVKLAASLCLTPLWSNRARTALARSLIKRPRGLTILIFAVTRLAVPLLAFVVLRLRLPSDNVVGVSYITFAGAMLGPGRDPGSPYNPGFDYLLASLLRLFGSPLSFVFVMAAAEIGAFALFVRTAVARDEPWAWPVTIFWLVNPLSLFFISLGGQDEALMLLAWCGAFWLASRQRPAAGGVFAAAGLVFTKILCATALLPLIALPWRRALRGLAAYTVAVASAVGLCAYWHIPLFGFLAELNEMTTGNVWALAAIARGTMQPPAALWQVVVTLACLFAAWIAVGRTALPSLWAQTLRLTGVLGCVFVLISPESWTEYLVMFLPGVLYLTLTLTPWRRWLVLTVFLPVCTFEPSLWFSLGRGALLPDLVWSRPVMLAADLILISGYTVLAWHGLTLTAARARRA